MMSDVARDYDNNNLVVIELTSSPFIMGYNR